MPIDTNTLAGILAASGGLAKPTVSTMTQEQIDAATAATVAAGGKSTSAANRLPGETAAQANERITAGYKELLAKPILPAGAAEAGASVQYVRVGAGGQGEYTVVTPIGYSGPPLTATEWTDGIIPATGKYTTGTSVGKTVSGGKVVAATASTSSTGKTSTTNTSGNTGGNNAPVGTPPAYVYNATTGKWEMPPKPTSPGSWVWDNVQGWVNTTVNPGSSGTTTEGGPTLAKDTFKNTLALYFGASEMSQAWVDVLYKSVSGFVNTGSDITEALNLALQDVRNNPTMKPFTDRFKGLYALQDKLAQGEAVTVPTIAEYFKTESLMGDVLRNVGLGDLANQNFLGDVLGRGKSLLEVTNLIDKTFSAIDNAPDALKKDLQEYFPGVDRTSIAKALLTGTQGWAELDKKVKGISVLSAARTQGVNVDLGTATNIALAGGRYSDYSGALVGFQNVKELERGQMLGQMSGINFGQNEAIAATFNQDAKALADIERIKQAEMVKYAGSAGRLASRSRNAGLY